MSMIFKKSDGKMWCPKCKTRTKVSIEISETKPVFALDKWCSKCGYLQNYWHKKKEYEQQTIESVYGKDGRNKPIKIEYAGRR